MQSWAKGKKRTRSGSSSRCPVPGPQAIRGHAWQYAVSVLRCRCTRPVELRPAAMAQSAHGHHLCYPRPGARHLSPAISNHVAREFGNSSSMLPKWGRSRRASEAGSRLYIPSERRASFHLRYVVQALCYISLSQSMIDQTPTLLNIPSNHISKSVITPARWRPVSSQTIPPRCRRRSCPTRRHPVTSSRTASAPRDSTPRSMMP